MTPWLDRAMGGGLGIALVVTVLCGIIVLVFTANFIRLRRRLPDPALLPGERPLDELSHDALLSTSRFVLTDRRIVIQRLRWPFTHVSQIGVALGDLQSVRWSSGLSLLLLLGGIIVFPYAIPVSLLVLMLAMELPTSSVRLVVAHSVMPLSRPGISAFGRARLRAFHRFFRSAQAAWSAVRAVPAGLPHASAPEGAPSPADGALDGFCWGQPVWLATLGVMLLAIVQRFATEAVAYDHVAFAPLFLGLPLALSKRSLRDGAWAALLSILAVFSVKFPAFDLAQGTPRPEQLLLLLAVVPAMALLGGALASLVHPLLAAVPLAAWPLVVIIDGGRDAANLETVAVTLLAMAIVCGLPTGPGTGPASAKLFRQSAEAGS